MKEYTVNSGYGWHAWFWIHKEEFEGEWKIGRLRFYGVISSPVIYQYSMN